MVTSGSDALRRNLCAIYEIPVSATEDHPEIAVRALVATYGPLRRELNQRVQYGNEILGKVGSAYQANSAFVWKLGQTLVMMEQFPYFFLDDSLSTDKLVAKYVSIRNHNWWLERLGVIGSSSAIATGAAEVIKKGSVGAGVTKLVTRLGTGAVGEAVGQRIAGGAAGSAALPVTLFVLAGAQVAYWSGEQRMMHIRALLQHRFQSGSMTDAQYREVFGGQVDPTAIKKYWEYR